MKAKIAVVGMGQGGMVAAIKLARYGASVTVYEKNDRDTVGYDWKDDITANVFDQCGIERPSRDIYCQKPRWMFLSPNQQGSIWVPQLAPLVEISIDRRGLCRHFADLLTEAGGTIRYGVCIRRLVLRDERVVGVETPEGEQLYDLVIDASGLNSALRGQLPARFGVQADVAAGDMMYGYRAFFDIPQDAATYNPDIQCTGTVRHLGIEGLAWCNRNEQNHADVLVCRVGKPLGAEEIDAHLAALRATHAILGPHCLSQRQVPLGVRMGLATPVADGYVAIGDSACMTIPVMGSGIEMGMHGGAMLADWCYYRQVSDFTAANLWGFYYRYMRKYGVAFAAMDMVRRYALRLPCEDLDWALTRPLVTGEMLASVMYGEEDYRRPPFRLGRFLRIPFMLWGRPAMHRRVCHMVRRALWAMRVAGKVPQNYTTKSIQRWVSRYDGIIAKAEADRVRDEGRANKKK